MSKVRCVDFWVAALAVSLVLSFSIVSASAEGSRGVPQLTECTEHGISLCYTQYVMIFYTLEVEKKSEEKFLDDIYNKTCSAFNETSSCFTGFARCPHFMRENFTRREEGYRAFRAVMCNKEAFKAAAIARVCTEFPKMYACMTKELGPLNTSYTEYEELLCRYNPAQSVCYEKSWMLSCPMSLESTLTTVTQVMDAAEMLHDCKRMYRQDLEAKGSHITVGATRHVAAPGNLTFDAAEILPLLRNASQTVSSLTKKANAIEEAIERQRKENAETFRQLMTSIESLKRIIQAQRKHFARHCGCHSEAPEALRPQVDFYEVFMRTAARGKEALIPDQYHFKTVIEEAISSS